RSRTGRGRMRRACPRQSLHTLAFIMEGMRLDNLALHGRRGGKCGKIGRQGDATGAGGTRIVARRPRRCYIEPRQVADGTVAEWLRSGLQIRVPRFDSGRCLQTLAGPVPRFPRAATQRQNLGTRLLASANSLCYKGAVSDAEGPA